MDITLHNTTTGESVCFDVLEYETITSFCTRAATALCMDVEGTQFTYAGEVLFEGCKGGDDVGQHAEFERGACIDAAPTAKKFLRLLKEGASLANMPDWICEDQICVSVAIKRDGNELQYAGEALRNSTAMLLSAAGELPMKYSGESLRNDKEAILILLNRKPVNVAVIMEYVGEDLKNDTEVILKAGLRYASATLRGDREFALRAISVNTPQSIQYLTASLKADRSFALQLVEKNAYCFDYLLESHRDDKEICLKAVENGSGRLFKYASGRLRSDKAVALAAMKRFGFQFDSIDASLLADKSFMKEALAINGAALEYAEKWCKSDRDVVIAAVKNNWQALKFASSRLRCDEEIVLAAVKNSSGALQHAGQTMLDDKQFITKCVKLDGESIRHAGSAIRKDKVFLRELISDCDNTQAQRIFQYCETDVRADRELLLKILNSPYYINGCLRVTSDENKADPEVVFAAVKTHLYDLAYAAPELLENKEFILKVCRVSNAKSHTDIMPLLGPEMWSDPEIVEAVIERTGFSWCTSSPLVLRVEEIALLVLRKNPTVAPNVRKDFLECRNFVLSVAEVRGDILKYLNDAFRDDDEIVSSCLLTHPPSLQYASERIRASQAMVTPAVLLNGAALRYAAFELRVDSNYVESLAEKQPVCRQFQIHCSVEPHTAIAVCVESFDYVVCVA